MRRILFEVLLLFAVAFLARTLHERQVDHARLESNQSALCEELNHYKTSLSQEIASAEALRLRCSEYERLRKQDADQIRALGVRLKRLEATARTKIESELRFQAPLIDSPSHTGIVADTVQLFRWRDPWMEVSGVIFPDSISCHVQSIDTLVQVVHRVPHRFLFFRWGTKALRQEIYSQNPHSRIVYAEYIQIERRSNR